MASYVPGVCGYNFEFLSNPPDVLKCLMCHLVAREPLQHDKCGSLCCKICLEKQNKVCPKCRGKNELFFGDARSNREIQELMIKCVNSCDWTGQLGVLEEHLTSCPYSMVTCINKCLTSDGEEHKCLRKDLDQHLEKCPKRKFKCPHCQEEGTYEERTTTHLETCPEVPTKCPNEGCNIKLPAEQIRLHASEDCPYTMMSCKYEKIGCTAKLLRKDLEKHESNDKMHFRITAETVAEQLKEQEEQLKEQQKQLAAAQREIQQLHDRITQTEKSKDSSVSSWTYKLTKYRKRKDSDEGLSFPSFYTSPNGYHMYLTVLPNGVGADKEGHISIYMLIIKGAHDGQLKWPFVGTVTFELLNQLADRDHHVMKMVMDDVKIGRSRGFDSFIPHSKLIHNPATNIQYLKDDTLYFRVSVEVADHKPWLECTAAE